MPLAMARLMGSEGMLAARALSTAARSRGLPDTSPPPIRALTVISLMNLVHPFDFLASEAAFLCLILVHRLWPDIGLLLGKPRASYHDGTPPATARLPPASGRTYSQSTRDWPEL